MSNNNCINEIEVYKTIFDNALDIMLLISRDGRILMANEQAVKSYGYTHSELKELYIFNLRNPGIPVKVREQMSVAAELM